MRSGVPWWLGSRNWDIALICLSVSVNTVTGTLAAEWSFSFYSDVLCDDRRSNIWLFCIAIITTANASRKWRFLPRLGREFSHFGCEKFTTLLMRRTYTHTHTHPFNGHFSGTTRVGWYQKGKTNLDFTEARDCDWQWHQVGHMQVCTSSRQITMPAPHHSVFYRPDALPAAQPTASKHWKQEKHWRQETYETYKFI